MTARHTTSPPAPGTHAATAEAVVGDTVEEALASLELLLASPVLLADASGTVVAASPDASSRCVLAATSGSLIGLGGRNPTCAHGSCPLHPRFACTPIRSPAAAMILVTCGSSQAPGAARPLAESALRADHERAELTDQLALGCQERHLLHRLAGSLEHEIDHGRTFVKIVECLEELLPVRSAEIWVPDREVGVFKCSFRIADGALERNPETVRTEPELEATLKGMGIHVLLDGFEACDPAERLLLDLAARAGLPVAVAPLVAKGKLLGLLLLHLPEDSPGLDDDRARFLAAAARQTSLVLQVDILIDELRAHEGLRKEIEIARGIQSSILPQELPRSDAFELFAGCITAARVGGDYYDFFTDTPGELGILIADVSGHSVASGLIAMSFRSSFRQYREQTREPAELFGKVNQFLQVELDMTGHFLTSIYGTYDERSRRFRYVNAGHNPAVVIRQCGEALTLDEAGILIGVVPEWSYTAGEVALEPGDTLVLYTDGVVEAENQRGERFGLARLEDTVREHCHRHARGLYHRILRDVYVFQDESFNRDDITLIVLKVT